MSKNNKAPGILSWILLYLFMFVIDPIKWVIATVRRLTLRYPAFALSLVLGGTVVLIIYNLFIGSPDNQVLIWTLVAAVIGLIAMVTAMWPSGTAPELKHVDHKSRSIVRDWVWPA